MKSEHGFKSENFSNGTRTTRGKNIIEKVGRKAPNVAVRIGYAGGLTKVVSRGYYVLLYLYQYLFISIVLKAVSLGTLFCARTNNLNLVL